MERGREIREKTKELLLVVKRNQIGRERIEGKMRESNKTVCWVHRWVSRRHLLK